jgi:tetratricopeptide (TPR) repeat protein
MALPGLSSHRPEYNHSGIGICLLAAFAIFTPLAATGQGQIKNEFALEGSVRNPQGQPIAGATVLVQTESGNIATTARTDSDGSYRFTTLRPGVYSIRASAPKFRETTSSPISLAGNKSTKVDFILEPLSAAKPGTSSAETPEFFDEPQFTVAGVTETMSPGGHGSDAILRTTEALARETVTLKKTSNSHSVTSAAESEAVLRKEVERQPKNFEANQRLGKWLADNARVREAIPFLERAAEINPDDDENGRELARAYADAKDYELARKKVGDLMARHDSAELHHLLAEVEEKSGHPLVAVHEYQRAAELNPSEPYLYDWGAELLLHRAIDPAIEVFTKGNRLFPRSARMLVGLGVAWYARGYYDQAAQRLCEASDLNPNDPNPYLFLGRMQSVQTAQLAGVAERLGRYSHLQPENALANYYYALSLWKGRKGPENTEDLDRVESLLKKAVELDPKLGIAHLQLGVLDSERENFSAAISDFQKAIDASPDLEEAHYRLALAYKRTGENLKAQRELEIYNRISKQAASQAERERREVQQFVYKMQGRPSEPQPQ